MQKYHHRSTAKSNVVKITNDNLHPGSFGKFDKYRLSFDQSVIKTARLKILQSIMHCLLNVKILKPKFSNLVTPMLAFMKWIGFCLLGATLVIPAYAHLPQFTLNLTTDSFINSVNLPQPKRIGDVTLANEVTLPAYKVYFINALQDAPYVSQEPESLKINKSMSPDEASDLAVYYFADRWLLLPDGWRLTSAMIAANGTQSVGFAPTQYTASSDQDGHFHYWANNKGCYGCSLAAAGVFFDSATDIQKSYYGTSSSDFATPDDLNIVDIRPHTKAWRTTVNNQDVYQDINGIIYWDEVSGDTQTVQVSLPDPYNPMTTPILNWYLD